MRSIGGISVNDQVKKKVITIVLLTALTIGFMLFLPENIVEVYMLPAIVGVIYSSAVGEMPDTFINRILHMTALLPLFFGYVIFVALSSGLAYLVGVLLQKIVRGEEKWKRSI